MCPELARGAATNRTEQSDWHGSTHLPLFRLVARRSWTCLTEGDLTGRAAQLAYYFFFSLFPGLVAASSVIGLVATSGRVFSDRLLAYLGSVIPGSAYEVVADTFNQTAHASTGSKLILGVAIALWSASAGTAAIQDALNCVYRVKERRPFWKARLDAIILTVCVGALLIVALTALLGGDVVASYLTGHLQAPLFFMILSRVLSWPIAFEVISIAFALMYYAAPDVRNPRWRWITPGSFTGILLWLAVSLGLRLYLHFFNSFSVTYGSLGAVIVLLLWFYLSGLSLLLGAQIDVVIADIRGEQAKEREEPQMVREA
jgi:membrane protein